MGIADSGHYYSLIKDPNNSKNNEGEDQWYEFNDKNVTNFDPKEIPNEAFGGEEKF